MYSVKNIGYLGSRYVAQRNRKKTVLTIVRYSTGHYIWITFFRSTRLFIRNGVYYLILYRSLFNLSPELVFSRIWPFFSDCPGVHMVSILRHYSSTVMVNYHLFTLLFSLRMYIFVPLVDMIKWILTESKSWLFRVQDLWGARIWLSLPTSGILFLT